MQRYVAFLLFMLVLLAACQPAETPAPPTPADGGAQLAPGETPPAPTLQPTFPVPQREFFTGVPLPLPGTLEIPPDQDPDAALPFDRIVFTRTGGVSGISINLEILADGAYTRNDVTGRLSAEQVAELNEIIRNLNFFQFQGMFTAPGTSPDTLEYSVMVDRFGSSRTVYAQDGFIPLPLMSFLNILERVGAQP